MITKKFDNLKDWIENAKYQFNAAMDEAQGGNKKVKIKWKRNPQQTVEVEPDVETEFNAEAVDKGIY